jgi:hypothetical protein
MKKTIKKRQSLWDYKIDFIVSEDLNKLKGKNLAPAKLELANERLRKIKSLPQ